MVLFGTNVFQIIICVFFPTFYNFVDYLWLLLENQAFKNLWRISCLGGNFVLCSRVHFTITETMNKLFFWQKTSLYFVGRSIEDGQVTSYLQFAQIWSVSTKIWQIIQSTFLSTLATSLRCYAEGNWLTRVCSRCKRCKLRTYRFDKKTTVKSTCSSLMIHVKRFTIQKRLLILLLLEDIMDWVLLTISTTCFIKANLGETLSSRTRTLFSSNLSVIRWKSARSLHSWVSDWS